MKYDPLSELRAAGHSIDRLNTDQRSVLSKLTPAEVDTLNAVAARIDAAGADVEAHQSDDHGVLVY